MKKVIKKEISNMLKASIELSLGSVDPKAAAKVKKSVRKAADRITSKFAKKLKGKKKLKGQVDEILASEPMVASAPEAVKPVKIARRSKGVLPANP